jgi:prepilin-type N-terminal cleavage/methylation domain-containing protein
MSWRDDSGMTLTELLVASILLGVILAAGWAIMYASSAMTNRISANAVATDESQRFLDKIGKELRQASSLNLLGGTTAGGTGAFVTIQPRDIVFYANFNNDSRIEKVEYNVSGGSLVRREWKSTNTVYPYTWSSTANTTTVEIQSVDPVWAGAVFTYFTNDAFPPSQTSQVASVTAVGIQVQNLQKWSNQSASYGASATVRVRAIDNKF